MQRSFKNFQDGNENLEDEEGYSHTSAVDNWEFRRFVEKNPHITAREIADELSDPTILDHPKQLGKLKKSR